MIAAACALLLFQTDGIRATRYEMGERLKKLDVAWLATTTPARRAQAVPAISNAVTAFFGTQYSPACRSLDTAIVSLEGRSLLPEDAIDVRFDPPFVEPGQLARLRITWAYRPTGTSPIVVRVAGKQTQVAIGESAEMDVDLSLPFPDVGREQEVALLVPISVGSLTSSAYVSKVKGFEARVKALETAKSPISRDLAGLLRATIDGKVEQDSPVLETLFTAEELEAGEIALDEITKLPAVNHNGATFAVAFPPDLAETPTVVIALHGAGGSESLFFEGYGRGKAALAALQRGWIFVSPRATATAGAAALDWLRDVRKINPQRVIVMGHSMGASLALQSGKMNPRPSAVVLFAPATDQIPADMADMPIFLGVGKNEIPMLLSTSRRLADQLKGRAKSTFREYPNCEHLMVVAEATNDAFRFLDTVLPVTGSSPAGR